MKRYIMTAIAALLTFVFADGKSQSQHLSLTNLYDAFGKEAQGLKQDFGFSCLIRYNGKTILFDTGTNAGIFAANVKRLKVNLKRVDVAIVSHGHYDHIGGFDYLLSVNPHVKIYAPSDFFSLGAPTKFPFRETEQGVADSLPKEQRYFRGERSTDDMLTVPTSKFGSAHVEYLTAPKEVLPGLTIIPTRSALMGTFIKYPPFEEKPQFVGMPELSAAFATEKGDVVISGCSHSTIETIIKEVAANRKEKVRLVVGGFHLIPYSREYIESLALRMRGTYGVASVAPAHCTGHLGFSVFRNVFGKEYNFFGLGETLTVK